MDVKGHKSCHGSYSTAAGWNYPVNHIRESTLFDSEKISDGKIASRFFSEVCDLGEFEGMGMCSGRGSENGSCHSNSLYFGDSGAFRCLVEELGDIAFFRDLELFLEMRSWQETPCPTRKDCSFCKH